MPSMPPPRYPNQNPRIGYGAWRRCDDKKWRTRRAWHWFRRVLIVEVRDQRTYAEFENGRPMDRHTWTEYRWRDAESMTDIFPPADEELT